MKKFLTAHLLLSLHLTIVAFLVIGSSWYIHTRTEGTAELLHTIIEAQRITLVEYAETTDRNGADSVIGSIVKDCPRRNEFDTLLGDLRTLSTKNLLLTQQLFESCGTYYAERKALMVSKIDREFAFLKQNVDLYNKLREDTELHTMVSSWESLIQFERVRSQYLDEQTDIQASIITTLITGSNEDQKTITDLINRARELGESLSVLDQQIDDLRNTLK